MAALMDWGYSDTHTHKHALALTHSAGDGVRPFPLLTSCPVAGWQPSVDLPIGPSTKSTTQTFLMSSVQYTHTQSQY